MSAPTRLALLRRAVRDYQGAWTTQKVRALYAAHNYDAPLRSTARDDLARLARQGLLVQHGPDNNRTYTLTP